MPCDAGRPNDWPRSCSVTEITPGGTGERAERIWIVIVNWRQPEATLLCLASLESAGATLEDVVVVDNESSGHVEHLTRPRYPAVTVLAQPDNLGFATAANIGARHAFARGATAVLLLNNDATLLPGAMPALRESLAASDGVGVFTAKVFLTDAPDRLWAAGGVFTGRRVVELGAGERDTDAYDDGQLDFVYGCAMLIRADAFQDVGGFDERYFLYYEDIDLCLRARERGWGVGMAANAHVLHEGSRSTRSEPAIKVYHHARSRALFFSRHLRASRLVFVASETVFIARRILSHLIAGQFRNAAAHLRGTADGLRARARGTTPRAAALPAHVREG
jgi:GT2 family glycosyltransferase